MSTEKAVAKTGSKNLIIEKLDYVKFISYRKMTKRSKSAWLINDGVDKRNGKGEKKRKLQPSQLPLANAVVFMYCFGQKRST